MYALETQSNHTHASINYNYLNGRRFCEPENCSINKIVCTNATFHHPHSEKNRIASTHTIMADRTTTKSRPTHTECVLANRCAESASERCWCGGGCLSTEDCVAAAAGDAARAAWRGWVLWRARVPTKWGRIDCVRARLRLLGCLRGGTNETNERKQHIARVRPGARAGRGGWGWWWTHS